MVYRIRITPYNTKSCPGQLVTDDMANAEGKVSGDEYFANLDYIEGVEKVKEGYESTI